MSFHRASRFAQSSTSPHVTAKRLKELIGRLTGYQNFSSRMTRPLEFFVWVSKAVVCADVLVKPFQNESEIQEKRLDVWFAKGKQALNLQIGNNSNLVNAKSLWVPHCWLVREEHTLGFSASQVLKKNRSSSGNVHGVFQQKQKSFCGRERVCRLISERERTVRY